LSLANAGGSCELTVPVNAIARAAGLSYKPTLTALRCLSGIGLLTIEERYGTDRRNREPSKYTLKASVSPCVKTPQPLCQNSTRVVESRRRLITENNTNNSSYEENNRTKRVAGERYFEMPRRIATWARRERVASIPSAAPAAVKPERPIWKDCARRCRHWDSEKRWCSKFVRTEPKSCEQCREF
jgi:hypothetical protein